MCPAHLCCHRLDELLVDLLGPLLGADERLHGSTGCCDLLCCDLGEAAGLDDQGLAELTATEDLWGKLSQGEE